MNLDDLTNEAGAFVGWSETHLGLVYAVKPYLAAVDGNLYRGSRLTDEALFALVNRGVQLVVNLCEENDDDTQRCASTGATSLHIRVRDNTAPTLAQLEEFLAAARCPENQPAYVHCEMGAGRTSVFCAAYRIRVNGWTVEDALTEARKFGMRMPCQIEFVKRLR